MSSLLHELRMMELRRRLEIEAARLQAVWRRGLKLYFAALALNFVATVGAFYWFAKLLGH